jgi:Zn-dependent protease
MQPEIIFQILVIVYSVILHEIAHGYAAYLFGDNTAYYQNRLTLNPLPHIDIMGSIIVPATLILSGSSFVAGWAKPVLVSDHNLNPYKLGNFCVSIAGVAVNFLLCAIFVFMGSQIGSASIKSLCTIVAITNLGLAIFNLIPVPPADGYRILSVFLPTQIQRKIENFLQQNFFIAIILALLISTQIFRLIFPFFYAIIINYIF